MLQSLSCKDKHELSFKKITTNNITGGKVMNQIKLKKTNWIVALVILLIASFGFIGQADAKSRRINEGNVEANAKASTYIGTAPLQVQFSAENSSTDVGRIM
jgi:hypothetical protein